MGTLQQSALLHDLTARIDKIQMSPSPSPPGSPSPALGRRDKARTRDGTPLHEILARSSITPRVTSASAAALNAERCAAKLKAALLQARKQPLKNISALLKPADTNFAAELTFLPAPVVVEPLLPPQTKIPEDSKVFFPSDDTFSVIPSGVARDRKASGSMRSKRTHHTSAPTAKSPAAAGAPAFEFGPLPGRPEDGSFSLAPPPRAGGSPSPGPSNFVPLSAPTNFVSLSRPVNFVPLTKPTGFVPLSASPSFASSSSSTFAPSTSPSFVTPSPSMAPKSNPPSFFSFSKPTSAPVAPPPQSKKEEQEDEEDEFDDGEEDGDIDEEEEEEEEGEEGEEDEDEEEDDGEGEDEEWDHVQTR